MNRVSAEQLYLWVLSNGEWIDGQFVCRESIIGELRRRGDATPQQTRIRLVRELQQMGLVSRLNIRSRWLVVHNPPDGLVGKNAPKQSPRHPQPLPPPPAKNQISPDSSESRTFTHNALRTAERFSDLETYMSANVLNDKNFICASQGACRTSIGAGCTFQEAHLSHLGKHYDLIADERPLRIVVVGQEVGGGQGERITLGERYKVIHDWTGLKRRFLGGDGGKRRNPHMRGTTLVLRSILGLDGLDHNSEFLDLGAERVHIFDCFALVNRLLCSAHVANTSNGKSTANMLNNCERHFRATLEILGPTLVVIQGVRVWKWSQSVLRPQEQLSSHLYRCDLGRNETLVATFSHPSARGVHRWDSPTSIYYGDVVKPTLQKALHHLR